MAFFFLMVRHSNLASSMDWIQCGGHVAIDDNSGRPSASSNQQMKKSPPSNLVPLSYWRAALAEITLCHPVVPADDKPIGILEHEGRWQVTNTLPDLATWIEKQFSASKAAKENADGKPARTIPFVLVAARLSVQASHSVKSDGEDINAGLSLFCIPCLLDRQGGLLPDPDRQPWIPRDLLEPSLKRVTVGQLDDQDHFLSTIPGKPTSFNEVLETAAALFKEVTGASLPLLTEYAGDDSTPPPFEREGHELVSEWHGLPYNPPIIARHLIKLYDHLIAKAPQTPTLDKLRHTADRKARKPISLAQAETHYAAAVGHIDREHPLSPSQREALVELNATQANDILAINGPPGTGKTTLLHSVVAQLWVDAALRKTDCPLIVVTSTNVKAVENVLDSFGKIEAKIGHQRWLPYGGGFGLFLASATRETKFPTCTGDTHPFVEHETIDAVKTARETYLGHATDYFGSKQESVETVVDALHSQLKKHHDQLQKIIKTRYAIFAATGLDAVGGAETLCGRFLAHHEGEKKEAQSLLDAADVAIAQNGGQRQAVETNFETILAGINTAERHWSEYLGASPFWLDLLSFLPPVRRRRDARDRAFLLTDPLTSALYSRRDDVDGHFRSLRKAALIDKQDQLAKLAAALAAMEEQKAAATARLKAAKEGKEKIEKLYTNWLNALGTEHKALNNISLADLNDALDTAIRAPMFCVADRYWSGRWLLEVQERLDKQIFDTKGCAKLEAKYRRFAKLSPCLVSNFHMAPSFFTAWQGEELPLWNAIDLLVVDEAGQVAPDVGAGMFGLARRALVVGDIHQIEPVWNTGETTDRTNAVKFGLTAQAHDPSYETLTIAGYTTAKGNLMKMAGRSCTVQEHDDVRGLLLTEHRRCVPELVAYCNALVYGGRLQPLRPSLAPEERLYPVFGWMDVQGRDKQVGSSRQNYDEASAIVAWLKENRARIENHYRDRDTGEKIPIWKSVGIVTPFSTQANQIERMLRKAMPELAHKNTKLTVGTVHALQGAERDIVIFSPTYGQGYNGGMFFDRSSNMLNVAVSRAKDSFLVIGNLALFDKAYKSRPSGLLASYLFDSRISGPISQ